MGKDEVAIVTVKWRVYHSIIEELREHCIPFITRKPGERIPLSVKAVITTPEESDLTQHHTLFVCRKDNVKETVKKAIEFIRGFPGTCDKLIVGIDPGKTTGLALVVNGTLVRTSTHRGVNEVTKAVRQAMREWKARHTIIKVGRIQPVKTYQIKIMERGKVGEEAIKLLENLSKVVGDKASIIFVDEKYTTTMAKRFKVKRDEKDKTSAVEIALR